MGREVRRVPADWVHPKNERGRFIPLYGRSYSASAARWDKLNAMHAAGFQEDFGNGGVDKDAWEPLSDDVKLKYPTYAEYDGQRPVPEDYMPDWPESERTHWQMYENTTEGTPISPVCETPEQLARWLADNGASAFGYQTATYERWLGMILRGWAPSMVVENGEVKSGVEFVTQDSGEPK